MLPVICFGEALIDFLGTGKDALGNPTYSQFPGGAPANVAVAIARLGGDSFFAGMLGEDMFGQFLEEAMLQSGVKLDYLNFTRKAKTGLAFVALDACGERSFEFYRPPAADLLYQPHHLGQQAFANKGIFHFCSNSLTENSIAHTTETLVANARQTSQLISFDINLRQNLWPSTRNIRSTINRLLDQAHILKFSREELEFMAESLATETYIQQLLSNQTLLILITDGGEPLQWFSQFGQGQVEPPQITVKDTTAGGDGFIGGFLYQLARANIGSDELADFCRLPDLTAALEFACCAGACTVSKPGAFWALPSLSEVEQLLENP
ncbi:carbohydrate kinase family protein [Thalassotalea mangrovi]|uniref:Carbohydrate kinase n=1 Tax=Thalassotalea mangrovi TaxID=2572245 RepID=A0A4U1B2U5_9GAMM|nr:carbohydrate kinase [Thalassotalea mangrovi]TKB43285.1 carbohydrate kinase [Thalassotalea mangrovi]